MHNPIISVIIPIYNIEKYIGRCLTSIIDNSYRNLQIICVNDGSTDHSLDVLKEYAAKDLRIQIISKPNGGQASARNAGMDVAYGEFVCFIDGDDWIHYRYFELLLQAWEVNGSDADLVVCKSIRTNDFTVQEEDCNLAGWSTTTYSDYELIRQHPEYLIFILGRMFRRTLIGEIRQKTDITVGEDILFYFCVLGKKEDVKIISIDSDPLYFYYRRPGSIMDRSFGRERWLIPYSLYKNVNLIRSKYIKKYAYIFILKQILRVRYESMFLDRKFPETKPDYDAVFSDALKTLTQHKEIRISEEIQFIVLWKIPLVYRTFRLLNDSTLFKWEKMEKRRVQHLNS